MILALEMYLVSNWSPIWYKKIVAAIAIAVIMPSEMRVSKDIKKPFAQRHMISGLFWLKHRNGFDMSICHFSKTCFSNCSLFPQRPLNNYNALFATSNRSWKKADLLKIRTDAGKIHILWNAAFTILISSLDYIKNIQ